MARAGGNRGGASGGRGFGSGGGRSFGGRSGSSSGGGGSFRRGGVSGGSAGGPRSGGTSRPPSGGTGFGGFGLGGGYGGYGGYNYGRGYGPGVPPPPPPRRRRRRGWYGPGYYGGGCFTMVLVVLLVAAFSAVVVFGAPANGQLATSNEIGKSTIEREKLPGGAVNQTAYYTDNLGWISNSTLLLDGMEYFYDKTGVQPYLYLADNIDGDHAPTGAAAQSFANDLYNELFTDEAHFLLLFIESNGQYDMWYLAGSQAQSVMDTEASNILMDYVQRYYYDSALSDEQCFSKAFHDTADRIMTVTRSPWIPVLIVLGVLAVLALLFFWWRGHKRQQEMADYRTAEILNTPLETYGDSQVEDLEEKYRNK